MKAVSEKSKQTSINTKPFFTKDTTSNQHKPFFSPGKAFGADLLTANKFNADIQQTDKVQTKQFSEQPDGVKVFNCPDYAGDTKLEACLNDQDRLKSGDKGASVEKVQRGLNSNLQENGIVLKDDGSFGQKTGQAVTSFKKKHNLGFENYPDVGPGTMGKLDELCATGGQKQPPKEWPTPPKIDDQPPKKLPPCPTDVNPQTDEYYFAATAKPLFAIPGITCQLLPPSNVDKLKSFRFKGEGSEILQDCLNGKKKLKKGDSNIAVIIIQQALMDRGFLLTKDLRPDKRVSGIFGNNTMEQVLEFQKTFGLKTKNGVVGKETMKEFDNSYESEHIQDADLSTSYFLTPPPAQYQPTPTTCWSATLLSWMKSIGEEPKPEPRGRIKVPQDYANFYGYNDDGTRKPLFLNDDLSLIDGQFLKLLRREIPYAEPFMAQTLSKKTSPDNIRKILSEQGYIYLSFGVGNGFHDVVVYGVDSQKIFYMDPHTAAYKSMSIPIMKETYVISKRFVEPLK